LEKREDLLVKKDEFVAFSRRGIISLLPVELSKEWGGGGGDINLKENLDGSMYIKKMMHLVKMWDIDDAGNIVEVSQKLSLQKIALKINI